MAVSTPGIHQITANTSAGFYEKLNTRWHEAALLSFMAIVLLHWSEHIVQAYQFFVLHWPRPMSMGLVGMYYHMYPPAQDAVKMMCTCARHPAPVAAAA